MSACIIEHVCINATPPGSTGHRVEAYANLFENHFEKTLALVAIKPLNVTTPDSTPSSSDSNTIAAALPLHIALAKRDEHLLSNPPKQSSRRRSRR